MPFEKKAYSGPVRAALYLQGNFALLPRIFNHGLQPLPGPPLFNGPKLG